MSLTSYRAAPSRDGVFGLMVFYQVFFRANWRGGLRPVEMYIGLIVLRDTDVMEAFTRFGSDLLSHVLRRSTIGATALNGRVRDGTGCFACAMATKPGKSLVFLSYRLSAT